MIEKDQSYEKRLKIAKEAFDSGCMIFASANQKWYTPCEFVNTGEQLILTWGLTNYPHSMPTIFIRMKN